MYSCAIYIYIMFTLCITSSICVHVMHVILVLYTNATLYSEVFNIITHKPITVPPQLHMYGNHDHNLISQVG